MDLAFGAFEERPHVFIAPARIAERAPVVVVMWLTAHVDHGVDGTGAAEQLAARHIGAAALERRVRFCLEVT